jgi:hypothetical protein
MALGAAVASIGGSLLSSRASSRAADTQAASADAAIAETRRSEEAATARLSPFTRAGTEVLNPLLELAGTADPTFERTQGFEDIQQSAAAGGKLRSGGTLRDLTEFNAGVNERFRGNRFNELLQIANLGQSSAAGQANVGIGAGRDVSSLITGRGDVTAAGQVGSANAISTGINELGSFLGTLKKPIATQPGVGGI